MEHLSDDVGELVEFWTLLDEDRALLEGRRGATTLGFALLLKHYSRHGRFPRSSADVSDAVVGFVARQLGVPAANFASYEWAGSTSECHRSQLDTADLVATGPIGQGTPAEPHRRRG